MPLQPLDIPPGIARLATPQASQGRWWDANLIRFQGGVLRPVGGWQRLQACTLPERALCMHSWRDNIGLRHLAVGTATKLLQYDGSLQDITPAALPGLGGPGPALGYGIDAYGKYAYGTGRPTPPATPPGSAIDPGDWWCFDNWGQDLLALPTSNGVLYRWRKGDATATAIATAPVGAQAVIVTAERHVVLCGTSTDPRTISWSDQENPDSWTPTITNLAGSLQLQTSGQVMAATRVREGILILTDVDAHLLRWVGPPYAYGLERLASGCGPIGPGALVGDGHIAGWMGRQGWWVWRGQIEPLVSPLRDMVFGDINVQTAPLSFAVFFDANQEIWSFYPSSSSMVPDRYVSYSWAEQVWSMGRLGRSAGATGGVWGSPLLADNNLLVQQHELGWTDDGAVRGPKIYAETSDLQLGNGDSLVNCRGLFSDVQQEEERVCFHFFVQQAPALPERVRGPYKTVAGKARLDLKLQARSFRLRAEAAVDGPWSLGRMRLDLGQGPRR